MTHPQAEAPLTREQIEGLLADATDGPWVALHRGTKSDIERGRDYMRIIPAVDADDPDATAIIHLERYPGRTNNLRNAEMIAAAPTLASTALSALAEVERLRAAVEQVNEQADAVVIANATGHEDFFLGELRKLLAAIRAARSSLPPTQGEG